MNKNCNDKSNQQTIYCRSIKSFTNLAAKTTEPIFTSVGISLKSNDQSDSPNVLKFNRTNRKFGHWYLRINGKNIKIYLYSRLDYISRHIIEEGIWEGGWLHQLLEFMKLYPKIQLLDFGCNIGVYTLAVAGHGYKVLAVDANINNTDRLTQSIIENNFQKKVIVVLNALSDVKKEFSMSVVRSNIGGQGLIEEQSKAYKIKSIFIDELLEFVDENQKVVIKMDIEGSEVNAMRMAGKLFAKRQIVAVFMEWFIIKTRSDIDYLINFFIKRNFRPFKDFFSIVELNISTQQFWPIEVVWRKFS